MSDKAIGSAAPSYYAVLYAELRVVARAHGYALGLHGSLRRDLDLIAVPWIETPSDEATFVEAMRQAAEGYVLPKEAGGSPFGLKPHGRRAYTIVLKGCSATVPPDQFASFIDLSIVP